MESHVRLDSTSERFFPSLPLQHPAFFRNVLLQNKIYISSAHYFFDLEGVQKTVCSSLRWPLAIHTSHSISTPRGGNNSLLCKKAAIKRRKDLRRESKRSCMTFARERKKAAKSLSPIHIQAQFSMAGKFCRPRTRHSPSLSLSSPLFSAWMNSNFHFTTRLNQVSPVVRLSIHSHSAYFFVLFPCEINIGTSFDSSSGRVR